MVNFSKMSRWHRIELLGTISFVLVLFGIFAINQMDFSSFIGSGNLVTGYVSSDVITENINLLIEQSQEYLLSSEQSFELTSLRLSGLVEGEGLVKIFLENSQGERMLVYNNAKEKGTGNLITGRAEGSSGNLITGKAVAAAESEAVSISLAAGQLRAPLFEEPGEGFGIAVGSFYNECHETCFLSVMFSPENSNKLFFELSEGVKLRISQLSYTTK